MKKFVLVLAVCVMLACFGLATVACSNVNQINFISVVARDYEQFTYTVYDATTLDADDKPVNAPIGTYVVTFERLSAAEGEDAVEYVINDQTYSLKSGGVLHSKLSITAGQYQGETMESTVLFQNAFSPIASCKTYCAMTNGAKDEARSYTSAIDYTGKSIAISVNGSQKTFKKQNYCYDNESLYSLVRGSDITRTSYSLSVAGVDNLQGGTRTVTVGLYATEVPLEIEYLGTAAVSTKKIALNASAEYGSGTTTYIYFLPSYEHTNKAENKVGINKLPVRIEEPGYYYVLSNVSTDKA